MKGNTELSQFFTPAWAAELIIQHFYPSLGSGDTVFDLGCGDGRFLMALPDEVCAFGFEIDPDMAALARSNSGREIVVGDFSSAPWPEVTPTLIIGNPPYDMSLVDKALARSYEALDYDGEVGMILPAYFFQTAATVMDYAEKWSLKPTFLPRNLFDGMSKPLMFAQFKKELKTTMVGFFLYEETRDVLSFKRQYKTLFVGNSSSTHVWGEAIEKALLALGGTASLQDIYREIEGSRPTNTQFWKEQIRKVARQFFLCVEKGVYALQRHEGVESATGGSQLSLAI